MVSRSCSRPACCDKVPPLSVRRSHRNWRSDSDGTGGSIRVSRLLAVQRRTRDNSPRAKALTYWNQALFTLGSFGKCEDPGAAGCRVRHKPSHRLPLSRQGGHGPHRGGAGAEQEKQTIRLVVLRKMPPVRWCDQAVGYPAGGRVPRPAHGAGWKQPVTCRGAHRVSASVLVGCVVCGVNESPPVALRLLSSVVGAGAVAVAAVLRVAPAAVPPR